MKDTKDHELYASAFKHGGEAALEFIEQNYPGLNISADDEDYPSVAKATMEHIEGVAKLIANPFTPQPTSA